MNTIMPFLSSQLFHYTWAMRAASSMAIMIWSVVVVRTTVLFYPIVLRLVGEVF
jgi:hypothetical protein